MVEAELEAEKYFDCTDKERIAFELGIKLGALFHQFIGTPVSSNNIDVLKEAMEKTIESQAFVISANIDIYPHGSDTKRSGPFDYTTLREDMIEAEVTVKYKGLRAVGRMKYIDEIDYPLMFVEKIEEI